ncbi:MAG: hypothetical protein HY698_02230 [Deltaproteobacteria bacterium]|nr:hypothetical protein [Deltaproteobacteria bacterium]
MRVLNVEPLRYGAELRARLGEVVQVDYAEVADEAQLVTTLEGAPYGALFTRLGLSVGAAVTQACPTLKWVVTPTTGVDHLDLEELERARVTVISLRGEIDFLRYVRSTAEHAWALLLALVRRLPQAHADVLAENWRREPFLSSELHGKQLGLVGVGRVGAMVAGFGAAFRMRACGFDRDPNAVAAAEGPVQPVGLDELLATSDIVSLHLPLDEWTRGFLNAERLAAMKQGALLVNTARGELVDEKALLESLERHHLGGAALDVLCGDGIWAGRVPAEHPMVHYARHHSNLVLTPHMGGYGRESIEATRRFVTEKFLAGIRAPIPAPHLGCLP